MSDPLRNLPDEMAVAWPVASWRDVHVAVAVSGGADSMALLRGLLELKAAAGGAGRVYAVHVNHLLRGAASDADEQWLRRQCEGLRVPMVVERANARELAAERGDGLEEAAREARRRCLAGVAESLGARYVATGHTADDQVETVLFRLLRGSGMRGLAGMPAVRPLSASVTLVRPMLGLRRAEVVRYLDSVGQQFREDATNAELGFARNRLRHGLLPLLRREYNAEVDAALLRIATYAGETQAIIDNIAGGLLRQCIEVSVERGFAAQAADEVHLALAPLAGQPELIVCEVLRLAWREAGFPEQAMTGRAWRELAQFAQLREAGGLSLPGGVQASLTAPGVLALRAGRLP